MLQISIFWVVIIIFAIHTILTHFFNWFFRLVHNDPVNDYTVPLVFGQLLELALIVAWLEYTIR